MALCNCDQQTAKAWLAAGHSPMKIACWLFCDVRHVENLIGRRPNKVATPPTPTEIRRRSAEVRSADDEAGRQRRDVYRQRQPMKIPIICLQSSGVAIDVPASV